MDKKTLAVFGGIKKRCYNKSADNYMDYGGRGITMYEGWVNNYKAFHDYVSSLPGFKKGNYSLDRINNNGNYVPGNLRWTTRHIQNINQRLKKSNKTGYFGVSFEKRNSKYRARITVMRKHKHIGCYDTPREAAKGRDLYIIKNELVEYPLQVLRSRKKRVANK